MIKGVLKRILMQSFLLPQPADRRFIFLLHDISNPGEKHYSPHYSTSESNFREIVSFINKNYRIVPLNEITDPSVRSGRRNLASIVFDDGFRTVLTRAYPILKKENIPFTVFLNQRAVEKGSLWITYLSNAGREQLEALWRDIFSAIVSREKFLNDPLGSLLFSSFNGQMQFPEGTDGAFLNEEEVRKLIRGGVMIGNHTSDHPVLSRCTASIASQQISDCKKALQSLSGKEITHFAIPFGKKEHYNDDTTRIAKEAGCNYIYSTNPMYFTSSDLANGAVLPRIGIADIQVKELLFYINRTLFRKYNI